MKTDRCIILIFILLSSFAFASKSKFRFLENYILEEIEYDCFSEPAVARIYTAEAGVREITIESSEDCNSYLQVQSKVFYECHKESGLNRFEINETTFNVEHSFKLNSQRNCSEKKEEHIDRYFRSFGI